MIPEGEAKGMMYVVMVEAPLNAWTPARRDGASWAKGVEQSKLAPLGASVVDRLVYCSADRATAAADVAAWFCSGFGDIFNPTTFVKPSRTLAIIKPTCASLHMGGVRAVLGSQGFTITREMQLQMTPDQVRGVGPEPRTHLPRTHSPRTRTTLRRCQLFSTRRARAASSATQSTTTSWTA